MNRKIKVFLATACSAVIALGGTAYATDGMVADGDLSDGIQTNIQGKPQSETLELGDVCPGGSAPSSAANNLALALVRGNNDNNRFTNTADVSFVVQEATDSTQGVLSSTTPASVTLVDWDNAAPDDRSASTQARVALAVPVDAPVGPATGSVGYRASGPQHGGGTNQVNHGLSVTWNVLDATDTACDDSVTYTATYKQPIDGDAINKGKLGRTIPVKVSITASDGSDVTGPVYLGARKTDCSINVMPTDVVESYAAGNANAGNTFRPEDGGWIYNLDTGKLPGAAVGQCYQLDLYVGGTLNSSGIASGGQKIDLNGSVFITLTK